MNWPATPSLLAVVAEPHPAWMLPFALLLAAIAILPHWFPKFWHRYYAAIAAGLGGIAALGCLTAPNGGVRLDHAAFEYAGFISLIASLYVVCGGIRIRVSGAATPVRRGLFLLVGAVLANFIGTTGAGMVLIRPWLAMNQRRPAPYQIVFFIFIVGNAGGCLTPVGDPPLLLGYLAGLPFWWTLGHCWPAWLLVIGYLLAVFWMFDRRNSVPVPRETAVITAPAVSMEGMGNLAWLGIILAAVFIPRPAGLRELLMLGAAFGAYRGSADSLRKANGYDWEPLQEIAWLFAGIFLTMIPVLDYLELHAAQSGIYTPTRLFWSAGGLSAVLDNAPTYLAFLAAAMAGQHLAVGDPEQVRQFAAQHPASLLAISLGSVFFGAMTYLGNGPNFMVKSIATRAGVPMPGFFGYIWRYALPILLPVLAVVALWFLRESGAP